MREKKRKQSHEIEMLEDKVGQLQEKQKNETKNWYSAIVKPI